MAIAQVRRAGKGFLVLARYIDCFKNVNNALDHPIDDFGTGYLSLACLKRFPSMTCCVKFKE